MTVVASDSLLDRLRGTGTDRPRVDPELAGGLREWLEDALAECSSRLSSGPAVQLNDRVRRRLADKASAEAPEQTAMRNLVGCLFRQWVTSRSIEDPLEEAAAAHSVTGDPDGSVALVSGMSRARRSAFALELRGHADRISRAWPPLCASWRPRTSERIVIPLCGRRIILSTRIDLVVGHQAKTDATVCIVDADPQPLGRFDASDIGFHALLETLRSGAPPSRAARFHTSTAQLTVESVGEHLLVSSLLETIDSVKRLCG
jgi:hypothetical protein